MFEKDTKKNFANKMLLTYVSLIYSFDYGLLSFGFMTNYNKSLIQAILI